LYLVYTIVPVALAGTSMPSKGYSAPVLGPVVKVNRSTIFVFGLYNLSFNTHVPANSGNFCASRKQHIPDPPGPPDNHPNGKVSVEVLA
jgi:hypothetical protein